MNKKNSLFSVLQRVGQSFMFPIALLPIAGLLLGIGASLSNPQMIASYGLESFLGEGTFLNFVFEIMKKTENLAIPHRNHCENYTILQCRNWLVSIEILKQTKK